MVTRWVQRVPHGADVDPPQQAGPRRARRTVVGAADDRYEREADAIAARVVGDLGAAGFGRDVEASRIQRMSADHDLSQGGGVDTEGVESRIQRMGAGAIGPEGGTVDDDVQARLDRTRGGGSALDTGVRRSMESAFGDADFGGVRIHAGSEAADLNSRLGARAFTLGSDIYLGSGTPTLSSTPGQHLLAHELAHTMQQGGGARREVVRRLAYNKPIKNVTSINVFAGGSSGLVAEVSDGSKPVIVKANQANAAEVVAADKLMRGGRFKSGSFKVKAPKSRIATAADVNELKAKAAVQAVMVSQDPRNFVTGLDGPYPALIAESMKGETLQSTLTGAVAATKSTGDDGKAVTTYARNDALVDDIKGLLTKTAPIKAMAKAMAADAAMGMSDRVLVMFNAQNFLFDAKTKRFNFVDNTSSDAAGSLTSKITALGLENARSSFNAWATMRFVARLATDLDAFATQVVTNFTGLDDQGDQASNRQGIIAPFMSMGAKARNAVNDKNDVRDELTAIIMANHASLTAAARSGVKSGLATVLKSLANPLPLTRGLPDAERLEAVTSLLARRNLLKGQADPNAAWEAANAQARKLLKLPFKPAVPALNMGQMPKLT